MAIQKHSPGCGCCETPSPCTVCPFTTDTVFTLNDEIGDITLTWVSASNAWQGCALRTVVTNFTNATADCPQNNGTSVSIPVWFSLSCSGATPTVFALLMSFPYSLLTFGSTLWDGVPSDSPALVCGSSGMAAALATWASQTPNTCGFSILVRTYDVTATTTPRASGQAWIKKSQTVDCNAKTATIVSELIKPAGDLQAQHPTVWRIYHGNTWCFNPFGCIQTPLNTTFTLTWP